MDNANPKNKLPAIRPKSMNLVFCVDNTCSPTSSPSRDSGYGSKSTTPARPSTPKASRSIFAIGSYTLDGNSFDSPERASNPEGVPNSNFTTPEKNILGAGTKHKDPASIPSNRRGSFRSCLPASFFSTSATKIPSLWKSEGSLSCPKPALPSIRRSDRFVHPRDPDRAVLPVSDRFRLTKSFSDLSPAEKLFRHSGATPDVFFASPSRINPLAGGAEDGQMIEQEARNAPVARARTTLGSVDLNSDLESAQNLHPNSDFILSDAPATANDAVDGGNGSFFQSGTNAPYFASNFSYGTSLQDDENRHKGRLAAALNVDLASRLLDCNLDGRILTSCLTKQFPANQRQATWDGTKWVKDDDKKRPSKQKHKQDPCPLRILSAPKLRDDFYCSILAYSPTSDTLVIGLGDMLYRWTEDSGARWLNGSETADTWLTSLAFSSAQGGKSILAFGRSNNMLGLLSMYESGVSRMLIQESAPISCLSWRPTCTTRPSKNPHNPDAPVKTEDLLVGDDTGNVMYYVVEWPDTWEAERDNWKGEMTLVARVSVHYQQICGLAWSADGSSFSTGGNDNVCCFFYADDVLPKSHRAGRNGKASLGQPRRQGLLGDAGSRLSSELPGGSQVRERLQNEQYVRRLGPGSESWRWDHGAAVKAIAFCPWQEGLVATGGGSNDKCIHFFHTTSGAALATIYVASQVTSLIWSTTRREIAATFGYSYPYHPIRTAVYSWPDCKQVAAIPLDGMHRALYGVSCARGPYCTPKRGIPNNKRRKNRVLKEGCIAIAASDESVKFYELWPPDSKPVIGGAGMLGGSDILEDMEGIQKEGDIIR